VAVAALLVLVGVLSHHNRSKPSSESTTGQTGSVQLGSVEQEVPLRGAERAAVRSTLQRFVDTAVSRRDIAGAYDLITSDLKEGMSRREWAKGNIPVYPFPAARQRVAISFVDFSYPHDVEVDTLLQPKRGSSTGPLAFSVELKKLRGRWLVASFLPQKQLPPGSAAGGGAKAKPVKIAHPYGRGHLDPKWFAIPIALLALIVLVPLGFAVRNLLRRRRIEREFRSDRPLPPVPRR